MKPTSIASLLTAALLLVQAAASTSESPMRNGAQGSANRGLLPSPAEIADEAAAAARNKSSRSSGEPAPGPWLLVAEPQQLSRISLEGPVPRRQLLDRSPHIGGMDLLASDGRVFWSETSTGRIYERRLGEALASEARCVYELSPREWRPRAVAAHEPAGRLYVLDSRGKRLQAIELRTGDRSVLLEGRLRQPTDLALDSAEDLLFVADRTRIVRSRLDGSEVQLVVSHARYRIVALALDPGNRRVLWADLAFHRIKSASYEGADVRVLLKNRVGQGLSVLGPAQLAYHRNTLYYYDDVYRRISALQLDEQGRLIRGTNASLVYDGLDARSIKLIAV